METRPAAAAEAAASVGRPCAVNVLSHSRPALLNTARLAGRKDRSKAPGTAVAKKARPTCLSARPTLVNERQNELRSQDRGASGAALSEAAQRTGLHNPGPSARSYKIRGDSVCQALEKRSSKCLGKATSRPLPPHQAPPHRDALFDRGGPVSPVQSREAASSAQGAHAAASFGCDRRAMSAVAAH